MPGHVLSRTWICVTWLQAWNCTQLKLCFEMCTTLLCQLSYMGAYFITFPSNFCLPGKFEFLVCGALHSTCSFSSSTSYLEVPGRLHQDLFSVSFQFRTWNPNGLLLFSHFADNLGNVEIDLTESKVGGSHQCHADEDEPDRHVRSVNSSDARAWNCCCDSTARVVFLLCCWHTLVIMFGFRLWDLSLASWFNLHGGNLETLRGCGQARRKMVGTVLPGLKFFPLYMLVPVA